jgi:ribonuclease P protein component
MKLMRLHGRKTSDFLLRKGRVWKGKTFTAYWLPGPPKREGERRGLFVGTFASAKLDKSAVRRNRMRRRVREALRVAVQNTTVNTSAQLLVTPRSASLTTSFLDMQKEVHTFLTQLPPWLPPKNLPASGISSS